MHQARQRVKIMGAVFLALFALLAAFAVTQRVLATEPDDGQYEEPTAVCPETEDGCEPTDSSPEPTTVEPTVPAPPEETTVMPPEETTMPTVPEPTEPGPEPTASAPPETTTPGPPEDSDGPDRPDNPDNPDEPPVVVVEGPEEPDIMITVTEITETTLVCETPMRTFGVPRVDLDGDGTITNVEDRAMVVAGETASVDAVVQNTAATDEQAEAAVETASLPDTGGLPLLPIGAIALGTALISFGLIRSR